MDSISQINLFVHRFFDKKEELNGGLLSMSKISQKMYSALIRGGVTAEVSRRIAESLDYLGESTEATNERDNYDILLAAKAVSSLVKRHKDIEPIMPQMPEEISTDMTRVNAAVKTPEIIKISEETPEPRPKKQKEEPAIIKSIRGCSPGMQKFLSYLMPALWFLLIGLLTVACIAAVALSIAGVVVITVGGIILFFTGLLYGVSQFSVFTGAAFFEIGLALIAGGLSVLFSVLIYNFLTRTVPFCFKRGTSYFLRLNAEFTAFRRKLKAGI